MVHVVAEVARTRLSDCDQMHVGRFRSCDGGQMDDVFEVGLLNRSGRKLQYGILQEAQTIIECITVKLDSLHCGDSPIL